MPIKTQDTATEETAIEHDPLFDIDLLYAEDDEGNRIPPADIEAQAARIITVKWKADGKNHRAEIRPAQITYAQRRAASLYAAQFAVERGVIERTPEELEANPEWVIALQKVNAELEVDDTFLLRRAEAVFAGIIKDEKGRARVSVPHWQNGLTAAKIANDNVFGRLFLNAAENEIVRFFS